MYRLRTPALLLLAALSVILPYLLLAASASTASFTPDSWAFRALADSVFQDFYRYSTLRSFDRISDYSWSFPPLWPVMLAVAGRAFSNRPETGVLLACGFALLTALPVAWIFRQTLRRRVLVIACTITTMGSLLLFTRYFEEVAGARAVPLSVFLLLGAAGALLTLRAGGRWWSGPMLGVLLGLACLTRFDALPLALLLLTSAALLSKPGWKHALVAAALFALTVSPWVRYSQTRFGTLWVSDNSSIAMSARNTRSNH